MAVKWETAVEAELGSDGKQSRASRVPPGQGCSPQVLSKKFRGKTTSNTLRFLNIQTFFPEKSDSRSTLRNIAF